VGEAGGKQHRDNAFVDVLDVMFFEQFVRQGAKAPPGMVRRLGNRARRHVAMVRRRAVIREDAVGPDHPI